MCFFCEFSPGLLLSALVRERFRLFRDHPRRSSWDILVSCDRDLLRSPVLYFPSGIVAPTNHVRQARHTAPSGQELEATLQPLTSTPRWHSGSIVMPRLSLVGPHAHDIEAVSLRDVFPHEGSGCIPVTLLDGLSPPPPRCQVR